MRQRFRRGSRTLATIACVIGVLACGEAAFAASATSTPETLSTPTTASSTPINVNVQQNTAGAVSSSSVSSVNTNTMGIPLPNPLVPVISGIAATSSATSTIVTWQTLNQISAGAVAYGTSTSYSATSTSDFALDHTVILKNLAPQSTYHFAISAENSVGTATSFDQTFTTPAALPPTEAPPMISMVAVLPTYSIATISWDTDQNASSDILYGFSSLYSTSTSGDPELAQIPTMHHVVTISNLLPSTMYHFAIVSANLSGATTTSSDMTFETTNME